MIVMLCAFGFCIPVSFAGSGSKVYKQANKETEAEKQARVKARANVKKFSQSRVKMKNNMYTGKHAWWLNYDFYPSFSRVIPDTLGKPFARHRYTVDVRYGISGLSVPEENIFTENGRGLSVGLKYSYYFTENFGFRVGFDFSRFKSEMELRNGFSDFYVALDDEYDAYKYDYSVGSVSEKVKYSQLEFPVQGLATVGGLTFGLGVKVNLPVVVKYDNVVKDVRTSAYYPMYEVLVDDSRVFGCGHYDEIAGEGKFGTAPMFLILAADLQYNIKLKSKDMIGIGVYADYTLNGIHLKNKRTYSEAESFADISSINGSLIYRSDNVPVFVKSQSLMSARNYYYDKSIVNKFNYVSFGFKISYTVNRNFFVKLRKGTVKYEGE